MLSDFEVHAEETQRCSGLPGCGPGWMVHIPQGSDCRHPLNSHCWTQRNIYEVRQNLAKGFNLKNMKDNSCPHVRYYILIVVIIMFLNNWCRKRQTASLASVRAAHDPWEQVTCGCRKKSPQTQDLRSTSLLQIRATWLKQSPECIRKVRFVYFLTEINW